MADRKVRLIIEIDDKDVKATEASLNRLGIATKKVGDGGKDVDNLTGSMTKASFAGNLLADVVQRLPELAIRAGKAAFDLAANYAQTGKAIDKARELTGLSTESLSALESQAKRSGISFDQIGESFKNFTKNIGDANKGQDSAIAKMEALFGRDWKQKTANLEDAYAGVLKRIAELPDEVSRANAAMDAFGEEGFKLIPFIRSFGGDIDELTKKAKELGLTLSEEDVAAAKEFDSAFKDVQDRARAVGITFGRELAEPIKRVFDDINSWLQQNKGEVKGWAEYIGGLVHNLALDIKKELNDIEAMKLNVEWFFATKDGFTVDYDRRRQIEQRLNEIRTGGMADEIKRDRIAKGLPLSWNSSQPDDYADYKAGRLPMASTPYFSPEEEKAKKAAKMKPMKPLGSLKSLVISTGNPQWDSWFNEMGQRFGVDPNVLLLQAGQESSFSKNAVSPKGAQGFSQFMPATAKRFGVDTSSIKDSIRGQAQYMSLLLNMFGGDYSLALAGYNAGEGAVQKHRGIPPYKETRDYVARISGRYRARVGRGEDLPSYGGYDPEQLLREQSDRATKEHRDQIIDSRMHLYTKLGLLPTDKELQEFTRRLVEITRSQPAPNNIQPTADEVLQSFLQNRAGKAIAYIDENFATPELGQPSPRPLSRTPGQQYIHDLRSRLGLDGFRDADNNQVLSRGAELLNRKEMMQQEINVLVEDENITRDETNHNLEIQLQLLQRRNLVEDARTRALSDRVFLTREIGDLEIELANQGKNDDLKIQAAYMRDILEMRDRELQAVIAVNRAQLELSQSMVISNNQIRAGVYSHLAAQKTLNEGIVDGINKTYDAILGRMNEPLDKLNNKAGGLLSFFTEPAKAMQGQFLSSITRPIIDKFFPGFEDAKNPMLSQAKRQTQLLEQIAANTGGLPIGYSPTVGGALRNIFSGSIFRGGSGPGGTPMFNPNAGAPTGTGGSSSQGRVGGLLNAGSLAMLSNPVTAAVLGMQLMMSNRKTKPFTFGLIGKLFGFGRDNAEQKLKEAAASQFGINVRDKGVLRALKSLGEGMFGRGNVGNNAVAVVRSEEGQNILRAYATSSGQSGLQIDRLHFGDPNWSGNQFRSQFGGFRSMGGSVTAGRAYVVGERRPELFVPHANGTILPAVPNVSTTDAKTNAMIADALYEIRNELSRLQVKGAGVIVREGAHEAGDAIIQASNNKYVNDWRQVDSNRRSLN